MRFVVLLALFAIGFGSPASGLSVCPTSDYTIRFEPGTSTLDSEDIAAIQALAVRSRVCDVDRVELIVDGELAQEDSLAAQRTRVVGEALATYGVSAELTHAVNVSSEVYGSRISPIPDAVMMLLLFKY